jgi:hypothetical protein
MILRLDSIMESKCKYKSFNEAKESCEAMELDETINTVDKLRGGMCAAAVAFLLHLILKSNFPFVFYFNALLSDDTYYVTEFVHK